MKNGTRVRVKGGTGAAYTIGTNIVTGRGFVTVYAPGVRKVLHLDNLEVLS